MFEDELDAHVTVIDVPALFIGLQIAAAGELGHTPSKRTVERLANVRSLKGKSVAGLVRK